MLPLKPFKLVYLWSCLSLITSNQTLCTGKEGNVLFNDMHFCIRSCGVGHVIKERKKYFI